MTIRFAIVTALLTLSLLLVSCGAASYQCTDSMGCLEIPPGSPILLATMLATEGEYASTGNDSLRSVERAIEEKNELFGHPVELIRYGTDCTAESARIAALKLATHSNLVAVIGPTCAEEADITAPILTNAGIVLLSPSSGPELAYNLTYRLFTAIEQVATQEPDKTLYIPRLALYERLKP